MNSVMIDLETWGTRPGCAIRSIGACVFDPQADQISSLFYTNVARSSCAKMRLHEDPETAKWWSEQSEEARRFLEEDPIVHVMTAVVNFNTWFRDIKAEFIWSHGAAFDVPVYEAAAYAVGFKAPWDHHNVRDTRTLFDLAGLRTEDLPFVGVKHSALDDAVHQARCVQAAMKRLRDNRLKADAYDEFDAEQRS